jgi:hypothetical protein
MALIGEMVSAKGLTPRTKLAAKRAKFERKIERLVESVGDAKNIRRQAIIVISKLQALAVEMVNKSSYSVHDHTIVTNAIKDVKEASNA